MLHQVNLLESQLHYGTSSSSAGWYVPCICGSKHPVADRAIELVFSGEMSPIINYEDLRPE